ncbi:MAG: TIGR00159 family protein [Geobacter sp.]|nr:TIGR00159 family protein [Geobacter sp.]
MFQYIRWQDIADIVIMTVLVYQLYSWFRNTKAKQVVIGLALLGLIYLVTKNLGFFMTSWILQELGTVLLVLIVVLFQQEIRQALYRFSLLRNLFDRQGGSQPLDLVEFSAAVFALARERTGSLIVFQRREPLDEYLLHGVRLDAVASGALITSIFKTVSPLHDGAVVIAAGRVLQASCHLPLSPNADIPRYYGTRHRAGLGLTERSDAVVVVVSEERGEVSLAVEGSLERVFTPEGLAERLHLLLAPAVPETAKMTVKRRLFGNLLPKLVTLLLVCASWLIITGREGGIVTVSAPVKFHNFPAGLSLVKSSPEHVELQLKMFSRLIPSPNLLDVVADVDLGKIREGTNTIPVTSDDIKVPIGAVVSEVSPSAVRVVADRKVTRTVRIQAGLTGSLPGGLKLRRVKVEPQTVLLEGPQKLLAQIDAVRTEEVDLSTVSQGVVLEKILLSPASQVKILREEPVKVRLSVIR